MTRFLLARVVQAAVTLLLVSMIVFALGRVSGNPAYTMLSMDATPEEREEFIRRMGLDRPLAYQYWTYLRHALRGDFGESLRAGVPATEVVLPRLVNSLKLATVTIAVTLLVSVPLGVLAAVKRGTIWDTLVRGIAVLGQALPGFWLAIVGILVFSVHLGWLPTSGMGTWQHYVLPAAVLGLGISAGVVRLLRSSMLEILDSEFVKHARAKGVSELRVIWKHAFRNALIGVVTFAGFMYGLIIAVAIAIEVVFAWPGLGRLAFEAVTWRDFPVLQLTVLLWAALVIVINLLTDLSYVLIDPRIRL
jgi:peptide/nickel transport system permease protein